MRQRSTQPGRPTWLPAWAHETGVYPGAASSPGSPPWPHGEGDLDDLDLGLADLSADLVAALQTRTTSSPGTPSYAPSRDATGIRFAIAVAAIHESLIGIVLP